MDKIKITYICGFSTEKLRSHLQLESFGFSNVLRKLWGLHKLTYEDKGTWNADFVKTFECNSQYDCYVISHHYGLKQNQQCFQMDGVNYIVLNNKEPLWKKVLKNVLPRFKKNDYIGDGKRIASIVEDINPDVVVVCGAENAIYSSCVFYIKEKPIFIILQTLANSKKRISVGLGDDYWRAFETNVFKHANYFGTRIVEAKQFIQKVNPQSNFLKIVFPSAPPTFEMPNTKEFDFVFFANGLSYHKGIEDALQAFGIVCKTYPSASFIVIGNSSEEYMSHLNELMQTFNISKRVVFYGHFPLKDDALKQVAKAKIAVLPGITAALNSTVREVMFMGIPTVLYETTATTEINSNEKCLLTAKMEDRDDLGLKMIYAYEHPDEMTELAARAKDYAMRTFSVEAATRILDADIKAVIGHFYNKEQI